MAGDVQRRVAVTVCLVDSGVGGEQQLHAVAVAETGGSKQATVAGGAFA